MTEKLGQAENILKEKDDLIFKQSLIIKSLSDKLEFQKASFTSLNSRLTETSLRLNDLNKSFEESKLEIINEKNSSTCLRNQLLLTKSKTSKLEEELTKLSSNHKETVSNLHLTFDTNISHFESTINSQKEEILFFKKENRNLSDSLTEKNKEISDLNLKVSSLFTELSNCKALNSYKSQDDFYDWFDSCDSEKEKNKPFLFVKSVINFIFLFILNLKKNNFF